MLNSFQKQTTTGKPVINRSTKLPEFTLSVYTRINRVKQQLGYASNNKPNHEQRWNSICQQVSLLSC